MNICLCKMTKELARTYYQGFENDPDIFMDMSRFGPYVYNEQRADAYFDRQQRPDRIYLAILLDNAPVGEIILKNVDHEKKCCTLSIHLKNDSCKNKGYGTQAEIVALKLAFGELEMETVYADSVLKNARSQHVLNKVGFIETHRDETFIYYRCDKSTWKAPECCQTPDEGPTKP